MKSITTTIAIAMFAMLGTAPKAAAHCFETRVFISGYWPSGAPIYKEHYFIGYDRCGRPVWGTRAVRPVHVAPCPPRPVVYYPRPYYDTRIVIHPTFCH